MGKYYLSCCSMELDAPYLFFWAPATVHAWSMKSDLNGKVVSLGS